MIVISVITDQESYSCTPSQGGSLASDLFHSDLEFRQDLDHDFVGQNGDVDDNLYLVTIPR